MSDPIRLGLPVVLFLAGLVALAPVPRAGRALAGIAAAAESPKEAGESKHAQHEELFKVINFVLLAGGLAYLLHKPLREFFAGRSASIRESLEEGRRALEASQAQLRAVEERLKRAEEEIGAFKVSALQEIEADRERVLQAAAEETQKILDAARSQFEVATRAARLELKVYAAQQAVELAEELIRQRLDDASERRLVSQFVARLGARASQN